MPKSKSSIAIYACLAALVSAVMLSACQTVPNHEGPIATDKGRPTFEQVVEAYVTKTRHWNPDTYNISPYLKQGDNLLYAVFCKNPPPQPPNTLGGDGCSFLVVINPATMEILKEVPFE